ncbi:hypothetical protein ACFS4T_13615 [Pseudomonas lini]
MASVEKLFLYLSNHFGWVILGIGAAQRLNDNPAYGWRILGGVAVRI